MKTKLSKRVIKHGFLFIQRDQTVRSVGKLTGWSKSTVFLDLTVRLKEIHPNLFEKVSNKLQENKDTRAYKGGLATQEKYRKIKQNKRKKN